MRRTLAAVLLLSVLGCSGNPEPADPQPQRPYVRLLDVSPPIGSQVGVQADVSVRAEYRVPADGEYHASLMFVTARGATVSGGASSWSATLTEPAGVIELSGRTSDLPHELAEPLTAVVMLIGPHAAAAQADTIMGSPEELRARTGRIFPDSVMRGDSAARLVRLRVVRRSTGRAAARSTAIFYNGAGPSGALGGPSLSFDQAIEEYRSYRGHKALAVGRAEDGRRGWGYSFGYAQADSAVARAMRECESHVARREIEAECRVYAIDDELPSP